MGASSALCAHAFAIIIKGYVSSGRTKHEAAEVRPAEVRVLRKVRQANENSGYATQEKTVPSLLSELWPSYPKYLHPRAVSTLCAHVFAMVPLIKKGYVSLR
jgi:hypothetical protein